MKTLGQDDYLALRAGAVVLEADAFGDKVLRLADGTILKFFRRKRLFSSAAWYPYAQRFADNAAALGQRGIPVPEVISVVRIPCIKRDAVHYQPLAGRTLREMRREGLDSKAEQALKEAFTQFVIGLHECGVYFRSLHLGNVVYTPDHCFGLIDISDARIHPRRLGQRLRHRNLAHLLRIASESDWVDSAQVLGAWRGLGPGKAYGKARHSLPVAGGDD